MAPKNTLEIIVKATTDQAQAAFKKLDASISTATGDVRKSLLNFSTVTQNLGKGFETLTGFSLGAVSGIAGVGLAVGKATEFLKDSISTTAQYGRTVYEMSLIRGIILVALHRGFTVHSRALPRMTGS